MDDLTALLRAHCAAAQAWRHWMDWKDDLPEDDPDDLAAKYRLPWIEAEEALTRVLEAGRCD